MLLTNGTVGLCLYYFRVHEDTDKCMSKSIDFEQISDCSASTTTLAPIQSTVPKRKCAIVFVFFLASYIAISFGSTRYLKYYHNILHSLSVPSYQGICHLCREEKLAMQYCRKQSQRRRQTIVDQAAIQTALGISTIH